MPNIQLRTGNTVYVSAYEYYFKLDDNDIKSLYISTVDGKNFKKLSPDFGELIDWNFVQSTSSIYFRIVEDSDKNGEFETGDKIRYFSVNLLEKELKAEEYFPV